MIPYRIPPVPPLIITDESGQLPFDVGFNPPATQEQKGLRFNKGKLRYDLVNPYAHEGMVRVLTKGSIKYAERNWEAGMSWQTVLASLKRHTAAFEKGEDIDPETGEFHVDHIQCNAHFLSAYYKLAPNFDDRIHTLKVDKRIGLDVDDVVCSWIKPWCDKFGLKIPKDWYFDYSLQNKFEELRKTGELDKFYLSLPPKITPEEIPFDVTCYISHRPVDKWITEEWLTNNGFPTKPVYHVKSRPEKIQVAKDNKLDFFVDDSIDTFKLMNQNGICCYLMDGPHNQRFQAGYRRIKHLNELPV